MELGMVMRVVESMMETFTVCGDRGMFRSGGVLGIEDDMTGMVPLIGA